MRRLTFDCPQGWRLLQGLCDEDRFFQTISAEPKSCSISGGPNGRRNQMAILTECLADRCRQDAASGAGLSRPHQPIPDYASIIATISIDRGSTITT
jgi:hypothetical protein